MPKQSTDWLTLSEASTLLGVHPITLRSWADSGLVRLFRTPGGHRRFRRTELVAFMETQSTRTDARALIPAPDLTLERIRQEMGNQPIRQAQWYQKLSDEQRSLHRELGQRLLGLLLQFVSRQENAHEFLEEARDLARQYGVELARAGLGSGDLARAFLFFRRAIIHATYDPKGTRSQGDAEGVRLLERINAFMDELLIAALTDYDRAQSQVVFEANPIVQEVQLPKTRPPRALSKSPHRPLPRKRKRR